MSPNPNNPRCAHTDGGGASWSRGSARQSLKYPLSRGTATSPWQRCGTSFQPMFPPARCWCHTQRSDFFRAELVASAKRPVRLYVVLLFMGVSVKLCRPVRHYESIRLKRQQTPGSEAGERHNDGGDHIHRPLIRPLTYDDPMIHSTDRSWPSPGLLRTRPWGW